MDRFIVGSGRCGSTLLTRMLATCPEVLPVSELLNGLPDSHRFADAVEGRELAGLLSAPNPFVSAVTARGYPVSEVVYPFERPGARYRTGAPLPWLLVAALPTLGLDDPDALFDETVAWLSARPSLPAVEHYRALFGFLGERCGRARWIERSGSAIDYAGPIAEHFPESRLVHLHREGAEVALSMREHPSYRLAVALRYNAEIAPGERAGELPGLDFAAPPRPGDALARILESRPDPALFGRFWSEQVERGLDALDGLPAGRVLPVSFEDLVDRPQATLAAIAEFLELPEGGWLDEAAGLSNGMPPRRLPGLAPREAEGLLAACEPVMGRLRS